MHFLSLHLGVYVNVSVFLCIFGRGSVYELNLSCHAHRGMWLSDVAIRGSSPLEKSWKRGNYRQAVQKTAQLGAEWGPKCHIHLNSFTGRLSMSQRP